MVFIVLKTNNRNNRDNRVKLSKKARNGENGPLLVGINFMDRFFQ